MRKLIRPCPSEWTTMVIPSTPYGLSPESLYGFRVFLIGFLHIAYKLFDLVYSLGI